MLKGENLPSVAPVFSPRVSKYPMILVVIISDANHCVMTFNLRAWHWHGDDSVTPSVVKLGVKSYADHERLVLGETVLQGGEISIGDLGRGVNSMPLPFVVGRIGRLCGPHLLVVRPCILRANTIRGERSAPITDIRAGIFGRGSFDAPLIIVHKKSRRQEPRINQGLRISP